MILTELFHFSLDYSTKNWNTGHSRVLKALRDDDVGKAQLVWRISPIDSST